MAGDFIDGIFERAKNDSVFAGFNLVKPYENQKVKYPIKKPYVVFAKGNAESSTTLLGSDSLGVFSESVIVTVATDEENGGNFCEKTAEAVCIELMRLDSGKRIISVSMSECSYDRSIFGYRITVKFGLSESGVYYGGE